MTVEAATYISQLDPTSPDGNQPKAEGDDQLRLLKSTLKATFPAFVGAPVMASESELSRVSGLTGNVQAQLDALAIGKAPIASPALTGTPSAPTQPDGSSSNALATCAYVETAILRVATGGLGPTFKRRSAMAVLNFIGFSY